MLHIIYILTKNYSKIYHEVSANALFFLAYIHAINC
jgi:hypothetical protein